MRIFVFHFDQNGIECSINKFPRKQKQTNNRALRDTNIYLSLSLIRRELVKQYWLIWTMFSGIFTKTIKIITIY